MQDVVSFTNIVHTNIFVIRKSIIIVHGKSTTATDSIVVVLCECLAKEPEFVEEHLLCSNFCTFLRFHFQ